MDREGYDGDAAPPESKIVPGTEAASVGEKRPPSPMEEDGGLDGGSARKMLKNGDGEMRKVAEMVLVLSAMGQMRGGRAPTDAEVKLMAEAREKLVQISQNFAPKELVAGHAVVKVIEDLGLNWKLKDQRSGFRGSRLSIKEKVSLAKRKMEEPKKFTTPSSPASQTSHPSFAAMAESRTPTHTVRPLPLDKPTNALLPSASAAVYPSFNHASAPPSAYLQASNVEVKGSAGLPISHVGSTSAVAASKGGMMQFSKMAGGANGNTYTPQANASVSHPLVNAPTWSLQPNSLSTSKMVAENKVPAHIPVKAEGMADSGVPRSTLQAARDQTFRPFITQTTSATMPSGHQPVQSVKSVYSNHSGIAKIVQKILQPKLPQYPPWIPPSREYMNKALTCQSCSLPINEVETVAICDACEKGFHLKCLESVSQKGVPRTTEWHCMKCTSLSNGKPFPPKYGRVMRSMTPPKGPASANQGGSHSFSDNKLVNVSKRGDQDKMSSVLQSVTKSETADCSNLESASGTKISSERGMPRNSITSKGEDTDVVQCAGTVQIDSASTKPSGPFHNSASDTLSGDTSSQQIQAAGSVTLETGLASTSKQNPPRVPYEHVHDKHESKSQNVLQDLAQTYLNNAEGSPDICQAGTSVEDSRKSGGSSAFASVNNVKQIAGHDAQAPPSLHDDKQSEDDVIKAPAREHDAKQCDQGVVLHLPSDLKHNANRSEQDVDHAPSASNSDVQQSEQVVVNGTYVSVHNVEQSDLGVSCAPSASDQNVKQGHAPFASDRHVKWDEQGVGRAPSAPDDNVMQSEQDVAGASSCPEHNVEQREHGVAHALNASGLNVQQSEHDVACRLSDSEHYVEQNEQDFAHTPVSEHNIDQSKQGVVHAPSALDHNVEQSGLDISCAPSDSELYVEQSEQGDVYAPASGHNVVQSEQDVSCAPSASEHYVEQKLQGFPHEPSASGHNVEQSALDVASASCDSEHNVEQGEQGVALALSASDHNVEHSERKVACAQADSEQNVEQIHQGLVHVPSASDNNVEQSEQYLACAASDAEHNAEESEQGVNHAPSASECSVVQNEEAVAHPHLTMNVELVDSVSNSMQLLSEAIHSVEWVGNPLEVLDEKTFYESCSVGGVMYKVMDHALFCSSQGKLIPSKLQTMWEDVKTGSKWVTVSRYYFHEELAEDVGQRFAPETNEVYDSNHETSIMAGSIQGLCKVLPPIKYKEESERRSQMEGEANKKSEPVFLCKWFFDERKGSFQPICS